MSFDVFYFLCCLDLGLLELFLVLELLGNFFDLGVVIEMVFDEVCSIVDWWRVFKGFIVFCLIIRSLFLEDVLFIVLIGVLLFFLVVFEVILEVVYFFNCFVSIGVIFDCLIW